MKIVVVKSEVLIGAAEYLTLYAGCRLNRCRYNRVRLSVIGGAGYLTLYAECRLNRCRYNRVRLSVLGLLFNTAKKLSFVRSQVFTGVLLRAQVFWEVFTQRHNIMSQTN